MEEGSSEARMTLMTRAMIGSGFSMRLFAAMSGIARKQKGLFVFGSSRRVRRRRLGAKLPLPFELLGSEPIYYE